jgi:hypothetical protein
MKPRIYLRACAWLSLPQGMAPRHIGAQAIDLPLWGGAMRCQNKSLVSMRVKARAFARGVH